MTKTLLAVVVLAQFALVGQLAAQDPNDQLFTVGLGRRVAPLDARSRALGGASIALHGGNLSGLNPASLARVRTIGVWGAVMPERRTLSGDGIIDGKVKTVSFPVGRVAIAATDSWTIAVSASSFFDRNGGVTFIDSLELSTGTIAFEETRVGDGGVTRFAAEVANVVTSHLSLGAAVHFFRGETLLLVDRGFPREEEFLPYRSVGAQQTTGWSFAAGAEWQPIAEIILGLTAGWGPGIEVRNDSSGTKKDFDLPLTVGAGASWQLTPALVTSLAIEWEGWSVLDEEFASGTVDSWRVGAGAELMLARSPELFARLGGRWARLPFKLRGDAPTESGFSVGLGLNVADGRARFDTALEFGGRADAEKHGVHEDYTRLSFGVAVFSN